MNDRLLSSTAAVGSSPPFTLILAAVPKGLTMTELSSFFSQHGTLANNGIRFSEKKKDNRLFIDYATSKGVVNAFKTLNNQICLEFDPLMRIRLSYSVETRAKLVNLGVLDPLEASVKFKLPTRRPPGPVLKKEINKTESVLCNQPVNNQQTHVAKKRETASISELNHRLSSKDNNNHAVFELLSSANAKKKSILKDSSQFQKNSSSQIIQVLSDPGSLFNFSSASTVQSNVGSNLVKNDGNNANNNNDDDNTQAVTPIQEEEFLKTSSSDRNSLDRSNDTINSNLNKPSLFKTNNCEIDSTKQIKSTVEFDKFLITKSGSNPCNNSSVTVLPDSQNQIKEKTSETTSIIGDTAKIDQSTVIEQPVITKTKLTQGSSTKRLSVSKMNSLINAVKQKNNDILVGTSEKKPTNDSKKRFLSKQPNSASSVKPFNVQDLLESQSARNNKRVLHELLHVQELSSQEVSTVIIQAEQALGTTSSLLTQATTCPAWSITVPFDSFLPMTFSEVPLPRTVSCLPPSVSPYNLILY